MLSLPMLSQPLVAALLQVVVERAQEESPPAAIICPFWTDDPHSQSGRAELLEVIRRVGFSGPLINVSNEAWTAATEEERFSKPFQFGAYLRISSPC